MEKSYLIQRLEQPTGCINPFSFGGGGGRMDKKAMVMLAEVWSWVYMGSAEFEYGAVPEAFTKMEGVDVVADSFVVPYKYEFMGWKDAPRQTFEGEKQVFYLCIEEQEDEVKERLKAWAKKEPGHGATRERICFNEGLADVPEDISRGTVGWFELDNGFFFFSDEKMWRALCKLLEVKIND